jgi:hypothetical protein
LTNEPTSCSVQADRIAHAATSACAGIAFLATPLADAARGVIARRRQYFGGIWFKIFVERGPCGLSIPL